MLSTVWSFHSITNTFGFSQHYRIKAARSSQTSDEVPVTVAAAEPANFLEGAEILELTLEKHRPLGCTVEESLAKGHENIVFCSRVVPDGNAANAGIKVGDVFIGVSGMFGDLEDVKNAGIERV